MRFRLVLLVLCPLLVVAACGGSSSAGKSGVKPAVNSSTTGALPTVSGSYGEKPTITTTGRPGTTLQSKVLHQGSGAPVAKGDLLVADYLGQIWGGKVFDNSYDRGQPAAFPIGVGQVVPGWDKTLVGVHAGSRVLLVLPPADGYGSQGNPQAGIKGTDTLVFVVDVISSFGKGAVGSATASHQASPARAPHVTGHLGKQPTVVVPKGLKQPTKVVTSVLAKGSGPALKPGLAIVEYQAVDWQNKPEGSTWSGQPAGVPVAQQGQPAPFDSLAGVPIGSRVLLQIPAQAAQGQTPASPSLAVAIDIVAQPRPAKDTVQ